MKTIFLLPVFFLLSFIAYAQDADSTTVAEQVDSLIQVSRALTGQGDYDLALELNTVAEKLALARFGQASAAYGSVCFNYGRVLNAAKKFQEAEKWYLESKRIREQVLGSDHPIYGASLQNLGDLYRVAGRFEESESNLMGAKTIFEQVFEKSHFFRTTNLSSVGGLYAEMGKYEKAEPILLEVKAIIEEIHGKQHPSYSGILNSLGVLYFYMGKYEEAEPLWLEALAIRKEEMGETHPEYSQSLNNLGALYSEMYNYQKAEYYFLEAKALQERMSSKDTPDYAMTLNNMGILYQYMLDYKQAEVLFQEAQDIQQKSLGRNHSDYAIYLENLGDLNKVMGRFNKAETIYLEVKEIREKTLGVDHPDYAQVLENLGKLYKMMGEFRKSEQLLLKTIEIREKVLGKDHPDYIQALNNIVDLYEQEKRFIESESLLKEISILSQKQLVRSASFLSERELANYTAIFQSKGHALLSFAFARPTENLGLLPGLGYDNLLLFKGFLLNSINQIKHLALADSANTEQYYLSKYFHRRLAVEYAKPITERSGIAELEEKANSIEKELARSVAKYAEATRQVNWEEVQTALKMDEATIEFVHFKVDFPKKTDSILYAALVLIKGEVQPIFVPLFEEKQLDSLLQTSKNRKADYVNGLYSVADRSIIVAETPKKTLYEILWNPLEKHLTGTNTIYFSASGLLHRLNFAAIPINIDAVLGDRYKLVEIGSTRQLVIPSQIKTTSNDALLFGGIQYDADSIAMAKSIASSDSVSIASRGDLKFFYTDSTLRVGIWGSLSYTDREVGNLEHILKTVGIQSQTRRGYAATEESFKSIGAGGKSSPRILHIATHGFFFPDPKTSEGFKTLPTLNEPVFKISEHPMIRSGLLLAGANHAWKTGKPLKPGMEDGILTAYEISQMNLSNTELVVLSACETGLGDIQGNEGVYGLQRAFKIAGAKYLIMSLWQVPDKQTSLLMTTFYKKWLPSSALPAKAGEATAGKEEKMTIPEAFRAAQKELRDAGLDPYQWAGFVLVE